ncbi:hypothetical protein AB0A74_20205 [Saccharothrix sp. NPDC042600]|uniref:hypothetical protein n=1 Tax=Saccharothrix TaxID=2071 RepID=UPI0033CDD206|nr:hypothetical protein GCM10017745_75260 [Saccharothrix mutabilis subsp. capreolus]
MLTTAALTALVGALAWSTTGIHHTLTRGMVERTAGWWGAWAVEPVISTVLLVVVGARAFLATRGRVLHHPHLTVVEYGALAVTLTLNVWPYLPWVSLPWTRFDSMQLLAHAIGPLVAVGAVAVLPIIWTAFADLDHGLPVGPTPTSTSPEYGQNAPGTAAAQRDHRRPSGPTGRPRPLDDRRWPTVRRPSSTQLRKALGCGTGTAGRPRRLA